MNILTPHICYKPKYWSPFIESFDYFELNEKNHQEIFQMHPDGTIELIFHLDETPLYHQTTYTKGWQIRPYAFIGGLHRSNYQIKSENNSKVISVKFTPGMGKYFIPCKLDQFTDNVIPITDIWPHAGKKMIDKILLAKTLDQKIKIISNFLFDQKNMTKCSPIDHAVQMVVQNNGIITLEKLAKAACLSTSQFRKRFKEEVGISPKYFVRIIRINAILKILKKQNTPYKLVDIAYQFKYFDQAHFIRDFKLVTGCTPKTFKLPSWK